MKRMFKKNQVVLTLLAVMIAVVGYLQYAGLDEKDTNTSGTSTQETSGAQEAGALDISDEDVLAENQALADAINESATLSGSEETGSTEETTAVSSADSDRKDGYVEIESLDNDPDDVDAADVSPGDAILTGALNGTDISEFIATLQLNREQVRAKSKENYLEIINSAEVSQDLKQEAVDAMVTLTGNAEKENAAESLLAAKGFSDSIVTIVDGEADVVIGLTSITEAQKAQIEDIVKRKCELSVDKIVISLIEQ